MSMVINLVEDHNIYLCEGGPVYNGGVQPTPITYLTQWKMMGNSEVHTDEYLTQWKVEGNSVVSNPSADLPQGYKKCKYLEFHGTEYINSGVFLKNDIGLSLDLSTTVTSKTTIGARNTLLKGVLFGYHYTSSGNYRMYLAYGSDSSSYIIQTNVCDGHLHHIVLDSQQAKIDNENVAIDRGSEFPRQSLYIGTWNSDGTADNRMFEGKMYSVRLYDSNGNLFNGIPCLDDNDVPCLYDTVSNTAFYNDGTGTFGYEIEQPVIYSCGDYSDVDGYYHVKISNGVTIYDIPLTEPLRKVNDVADSIEYSNSSAVVTRRFAKDNIGNYSWSAGSTSESGIYRMRSSSIQSVIAITSNVLCAIYDIVTANNTYNKIRGFSVSNNGIIDVYDENYNQSNSASAFKAAMNGVELIYELATPTTETIQVSPFPISPTDTYTSANDTPYSAFEYKKNVEIWSCGEYSAVDNKWHIRILPEGYGIVDIALDEPLRKVNDVADSIEFVNGVATVTRNLAYFNNLGSLPWGTSAVVGQSNVYSLFCDNTLNPTPKIVGYDAATILCALYPAKSTYNVARGTFGIGMSGGAIRVYDPNYNQADSYVAFKQQMQGVGLMYWIEPTTETIQVPQIEEAESYSCIISQGGKAVEWSGFETE